MANAEQGDRTEAASQRRLQRAREEGQVAISPELAPLFMLASVTAVLLLWAPASLRAFADQLALLLSAVGHLDGPAGVAAALRQAASAAAEAISGLCVAALVAGTAATLVQTGFLFNSAKLAPDLSRLSPRRGLSRLFGAGNLAQAAKSLLKLLVVGTALWRLLIGQRDSLTNALLRSPEALPAALTVLATAILFTALEVQAVIALLDLVATRLRHARSLRMSRTELREEAREADGSPEIKSKLRRLRNQRARHRMAQAVARATVVVTNPTHYAVALAYDRSRNAAPRVVAKGMDEMAARIRAIAEEHRVPLVANPPLARALHQVDLDSDVPPEHYQAVAELIAYVWRLQGQARRRAG